MDISLRRVLLEKEVGKTVENRKDGSNEGGLENYLYLSFSLVGEALRREKILAHIETLSNRSVGKPSAGDDSCSV